MSLNANAKAWSPTFGASAATLVPTGGAPPPPASALQPSGAAMSTSPTNISSGAPPPPASALVGLGGSSVGAPPPPPSALGNSAWQLPLAGTPAATMLAKSNVNTMSTTTSTAPSLMAPAATGSSTGGTPLHLAAPFVPGSVAALTSNATTTAATSSSPNHNATPFGMGMGTTYGGGRAAVPGATGMYGVGGFGIGFNPSNVPIFTPSGLSHAPLPTEQVDWFRYAFAIPSARLTDTNKSEANNILALQAKRVLLAGRTREKEAFMEYLVNYFDNVHNSSFTNKDANGYIAAQTGGSPTTTFLGTGLGVGGIAPGGAGSLLGGVGVPSLAGAHTATSVYQSPTALMLSRKMLGNPSQTDDIASVTNADGYLIHVARDHNQPGVDISAHLKDSWRSFMDTIGAESSVIGYWMVEAPEISARTATKSTLNTKHLELCAADPANHMDSGAAFFHYFFAVPKTPMALSSQKVSQWAAKEVSGGYKVTKIRGIVSFVINNRLPLSAHVRFISAADHTAEAEQKKKEEKRTAIALGETTATTSTAPSLSVPSTLDITISYNAYKHAESLSSVEAALTTIERFLTPTSTYNGAKSTLMATPAAAASTPSTSPSLAAADMTANGPAASSSSPSTSTIFPLWSRTAGLTVNFVDETQMDACMKKKGGVSARFIPISETADAHSIIPKIEVRPVVPAFDVLQIFMSGLAGMGGGVAAFERVSKQKNIKTGAKEDSSAAATQKKEQEENDKSECKKDTNNLVARNNEEETFTPLSGPLEALLAALKPAALVKSGESSQNRPLLVLSSRSALATLWGTLPSVHSAGSLVNPLATPTLYRTFRELVDGVWESVLVAESRTLALTTDKANAIANVFAREPYVVRRSAIGTRVLLVANGAGQLAVFDPQTCSMVSIVESSWSNRNVHIVDSVMVGTLTHTYHGSRLWRIIVEDVYRFKGENCVGKPFTERWAHVGNGVLESEGTFSHASPFGSLILHASYMNPHELHRLLDRTRHTCSSIPTETEHFPDSYPLNPHEVLEPVDHATLGLTYVPTTAPVISSKEIAPSDSSAASSSLKGQFGGELPQRAPTRPRSINTPCVRDVLRLVPTFTWIPQDSVSAQLAVSTIEYDTEEKVARLYLSAARSLYYENTSNTNAFPAAASASASTSVRQSPSTELILSDSATTPTLRVNGDTMLPPPSLGLPPSSPTCARGSPTTANTGNKEAGEPVHETHAKKLWLSFVSRHGPMVPSDPAVALVPIEGEYVEVPLAVAELGYVKVGSVIECLLRRPAANTRYWEYTKTIANPTFDGKADKEDKVPSPSAFPAFGQLTQVPSTERYVAWLSQCTYLRPADLRWLPTAYQHRCTKCADVSEKGEEDPQAGGAFRCEQCWKDSGYGDCVHCPKRFTPGSIDLVSKTFYCETCWQSFASTVTIAHGPQPPPNGANLELQVMTRVASLLIDEVSRRFPLRDVLDLSVPDTSVIRKWLHAGVESFTGVAANSQVAADVKAVKAQYLEEHPSKTRDNFSVFSCPYALTDVDRFWNEAIPARHPKQFSAVFCFYQLHKVFASKETARDFFHYISRALVPGGMFVGTFFCGNGYFAKGAPYRNDYFSLKWNIREYEENRARTLSGQPPVNATAAGTRANSGDRSGLMSRTETMVGVDDHPHAASGKLATLGTGTCVLRESVSSTPMPPTIDDDGDDDLNTGELHISTSTVVPKATASATVPAPPQPMTPVDDDGSDNVVSSNNTHTDPAATASPATPAPTPTTPHAQIKTESSASALHVDPLSIATTPAAASKKGLSYGQEDTAHTNDADALIVGSDAISEQTSSHSGATTANTSTLLVPSKSAWRPKSLNASAVASPSVAAGGAPSSVPTPAPAVPTPDDVPLTTDLTVPTVGLTFQISFSEVGGTSSGQNNASMNARENSSAVWTNDQQNSEVFSGECSMAGSPTMPSRHGSSAFYSCPMLPEGLRTENAIPLDLLCACAEECGFELLFDLWGKASDLIAGDGAWTKPLNPAAKEYFNGVKTVVFKKIARRPHTSAVPAPTAL